MRRRYWTGTKGRRGKLRPTGPAELVWGKYVGNEPKICRATRELGGAIITMRERGHEMRRGGMMVSSEGTDNNGRVSGQSGGGA